MIADTLERSHKQQDGMRAGHLLDIPFFDIPPNHFCRELAKQLDRDNWQLHKLGIYQAVMFVARCMRRDQNGVRLPDRVRPGEVFLIFATSDGGGCACGGSVAIDELEAARAASIYTTARERRDRLLELAKCARWQLDNSDETSSRGTAIECAGLVIGPDEVDALRQVEDALPAFVILIRRERGRSSVRWRNVCTTLSGYWLGTKPPAGTA